MAICTVTAYFSNGVVVSRRVSLARALALMNHKAAMIPADVDLQEVRGVQERVLVPTEIAFAINKALVPPAAPVLNKQALMERDEGRCAYCGKQLSLSEVTMDHVIPRSQGGQSTWENLVCACSQCNTRKANRTPEQAGMKLHSKPFVPKVRLRHA